MLTVRETVPRRQRRSFSAHQTVQTGDRGAGIDPLLCRAGRASLLCPDAGVGIGRTEGGRECPILEQLGYRYGPGQLRI